ncbi:hypothetical protein GNY06_05115 [Elizabethkingia argentiflava]|uniref:Uncharacterized protein n=1 Tax=Elizabethkingia argenteiflava TaxID=2681556 RepID=A0A845PWT8_9FLAO|nr:hypothetical protein [Elizabethkingia argenteiflava]NAW50788.1 hypothetical protein [Elizabethkingia argenteiflava]
MATIIKSDNVATHHLGSVLPNLLPKNKLNSFFDFSNSVYVSKGRTVNLKSFLRTTRSTNAIGINNLGEEVIYPPNMTVFNYVKSKKMQGISMGDIMKNHFLNSNNPQTQNITIDEGIERKFFLYVQVVGNGSVSISGDVSGVATEGRPLMLKHAQAKTSIKATVSGSPSYVQVSKVTSPYGIDLSRPQTASLVAQKTQDVTQVVPGFFTNSEITVFLKTVKFDGGNLTLSPVSLAKNILLFDAATTKERGGYVGGVEMLDGTTGKLWIRKQKGGQVIVKSALSDVSIKDVNVTAFSLNRTTGKVFFNGSFSELPIDNTAVDSVLNFLPSLLTPQYSEFIAPNSILTKMVVYDRILNNTEITEIYNMLK